MPFSFKPTEAIQAETQASTPLSVDGISAPASSSVTPFSTRFSLEGRGILQIGLFAIFGFAMLVTIILFGYNYYLTSQIENKKVQLAAYDKEFSTLSLGDMQALSSRIKVIGNLVREHPSVRVAFRILEESVENPVIYKSFDLHFSDTLRSYELVLAASAPDYHSVVDQMDTFKRKPFVGYIRSITLSGLRPDTSGKVNFNLKMPIAITGMLPEGLTFQDVPENIPNSTVSTSSQATSTSSQATSTNKIVVPSKP